MVMISDLILAHVANIDPLRFLECFNINIIQIDKITCGIKLGAYTNYLHLSLKEM